MKKNFYVYMTESEWKKYKEGKEALAYPSLDSYHAKKLTKLIQIPVTMKQCLARYRNGTLYVKESGWLEYI